MGQPWSEAILRNTLIRITWKVVNFSEAQLCHSTHFPYLQFREVTVSHFLCHWWINPPYPPWIWQKIISTWNILLLLLNLPSPPFLCLLQTTIRCFVQHMISEAAGLMLFRILSVSGRNISQSWNLRQKGVDVIERTLWSYWSHQSMIACFNLC